jgi:bisanhydrobacterioruberin hydratase
MKFSRVQICGLLIVILYLVGFWGFTSPGYSNLFEKLVPYHLLVVFALLVLSHTRRNRDFIKFLVTTYIAGFVIELLGVHTGVIFGNYTYGYTLGYKVAEIPLIIGINWIIMIYSTGVFVREFAIRSRLLRALLGATLLTIVDFLMEPVAVRHDYWSWQNFDIPIQNSLVWFVFSFILLFMFYHLKFKKTNPVGSILFVVQALFFLALNISLS